MQNVRRHTLGSGVCVVVCACLVGLAMPSVSVAVPTLSVQSGGADALSVSPGDTIALDVELSGLTGELAVSASFRVVFDVGGLSYDSYAWTPPFVTGMGDDLSAPPLSALPATLADDLFGGVGSDIDVSFDNFASAGGADNGTLATLTISVPVDFPAGSSVSIHVVPGDFVYDNSPFATTPAAGAPFTLTVSMASVVEVALRLVDSPTMSDQGALPTGVTEVCLGSPLFAEIWVSQVDGGFEGIAAGSVDVLYGALALRGEGIDHGGIYIEQPTGGIDNVNGIANDVGGSTLLAGVGVAPDWALLGRVNMTAIGAGSATLSLGLGAGAFELSGVAEPLDGAAQVMLSSPTGIVVTGIAQAGDTDCDGDVDLDDFARFHGCMTGPPVGGNPPPLSAECAIVDLDDDGDVDLNDFSVLQWNFGATP